MTRVFPRMAKCIYRKFGASGTIQTHDALCILPINVINEKARLEHENINLAMTTFYKLPFLFACVLQKLLWVAK
jgi:hypothetical protein